MITRRSKGGEIRGKLIRERHWQKHRMIVCRVITGKSERKRARERERKDDILAGD